MLVTLYLDWADGMDDPTFVRAYGYPDSRIPGTRRFRLALEVPDSRDPTPTPLRAVSLVEIAWDGEVLK